MISAEEHADRRARLLEHARAVGATGYVLFDPTYITYFTGFWFLSNERPIVYLQSTDGDDAIFVPEFEVERTRAESSFARVESYPEYPGPEHPMLALARVAAALGLRGTIAADNDGYPGILGYRGPALSDVTGASVPLLGDVIEQMLVRKSPAEVELLRESGRWCAHAHRLLEKYTRVGATEAEASLRAQQDTTLAMLAAHGSRGLLGSGDGAKAGYRGQIGLRSSWAHAVAHNIEFRPGDVLVTETGAPVWGYQAELERALVIGPPTDHMRRLFDHMLGSREAAFAAIRARRDVRRRRRRRHGLLRPARPAALLAPAHRARRGATKPRGAVPGRRRPDAAGAGDGLHDRAGPLRPGGRRLPSLRHCRRDGRGLRPPH